MPAFSAVPPLPSQGAVSSGPSDARYSNVSIKLNTPCSSRPKAKTQQPKALRSTLWVVQSVQVTRVTYHRGSQLQKNWIWTMFGALKTYREQGDTIVEAFKDTLCLTSGNTAIPLSAAPSAWQKHTLCSLKWGVQHLMLQQSTCKATPVKCLSCSSEYQYHNHNPLPEHSAVF